VFFVMTYVQTPPLLHSFTIVPHAHCIPIGCSS